MKVSAIAKEVKMESKPVIQKFLAVTGTVLVWVPVLAPILFSVLGLITSGEFHLDVLMPAEFSPLVLVGGAMLIAVLKWGRLRAPLIPWSLGIAILALVGGQVLVVVTGLASGAVKGGWAMAVVIASLVVYILAVIALGVGGIRLARSLYPS